MKYLLLLVSTTVLFTACNKKTSDGKEIEIYLLKSYQQVSGKCQVNAATAMLQDTATIRNSDIVAYSKTEYTFELTANAVAKIKGFKDREAFAITVDKQVIYFGFYKPPISSSSCVHSITMNNLFSGPNKVTINLGYAGSSPDIDDQRNNFKLIAALSAQGKLR